MNSDFICSAAGTFVAEVLTLPICIIKTNYQNSYSNSVVETTKSIYQRRGLISFYQAGFPAVASQVWSTSSKYYLYRKFESLGYENKHVNGMVSGIISSTISHPIDVVKVHYQMNDPFLPNLKKHGFSLFYRGYSKTFGKMALSSSLYLPVYDLTREKFTNPAISGIISSSICTTIIHPIDYLKTRHIWGQKLYMGLNPKWYYRGWILNMCRIVPHFTIIMTTIHYLQS